MPKKREGRPEWFKAHRYLRAIVDAVPSEAVGNATKAAFAYFDGDEPQELDPLAHVVYSAFKVSIDDAWSSYQQSVENGSKGGRPPVSMGNPPLPTPTEEDKEGDTDTEVEEERKEELGLCRMIVEHLNLKAGTQFKHTTQKTRTLIRARLAEGFTPEDFKEVIDKKCSEWGNDKTMQKYLRPVTLFGTKFEGYLNEQVVGRKRNEEKTDPPIRIGKYV